MLNLLEPLLAQIVDVNGDLSSDLLVGVFRKADRTGFRHVFDASRDIDAVPIDIAFVSKMISPILMPMRSSIRRPSGI